MWRLFGTYHLVRHYLNFFFYMKNSILTKSHCYFYRILKIKQNYKKARQCLLKEQIITRLSVLHAPSPLLGVSVFKSKSCVTPHKKQFTDCQALKGTWLNHKPGILGKWREIRRNRKYKELANLLPIILLLHTLS